jgi:hypothetical protein
MPDIWLSYVRNDRKRVGQIAQALEREGFSVAWDREIKANEPWDEEIDLRLEESACHCVCWSRASAESDSLVAEASYGHQAGKLVPITLQACDPPEPFDTIPSWDLTQWRGDSADEDWEGCVQAIRDLIDPARQAARLRPQPRRVAPARPPPPPPPPPEPEILVAQPADYSDPAPRTTFKRVRRRGDRGVSPSGVLGRILIWFITLSIAAVLIYMAAPGIVQFMRGQVERLWPPAFSASQPATEQPSTVMLPAIAPSDMSIAPPDLSAAPSETPPPDEAAPTLAPSRLPPVRP